VPPQLSSHCAESRVQDFRSAQSNKSAMQFWGKTSYRTFHERIFSGSTSWPATLMALGEIVNRNLMPLRINDLRGSILDTHRLAQAGLTFGVILDLTDIRFRSTSSKLLKHC
jgi:hypothetical protein